MAYDKTKLKQDFDAAKGARQSWERRWYLTKRFLSGDHYLYYARHTGKLVKLTSTADRVRRNVDLAYSYRRSLKNKIVQDPNWAVQPHDWSSDEAVDEARNADFTLRFFWNHLQMKKQLKNLVGEALDTSRAFLYVDWDEKLDPKSDVGDMFARVLSTFDVYIPKGYASLKEAPYFYVASRRGVADIQADEAYDYKEEGETKLNREMVTEDNKKSASEFKSALEKESGSSDSNGTAIVVDCYYKTTENEYGGSVGLSSFVAESGKLLRETDLPITRYPVFEYAPEEEVDELYVTSWMERTIELNKSIDKMISAIETYAVKFKPKYMMPKGSGVKKISADQEWIEYNASFPRAIGTLSPPPFPTEPNNLITMMTSYLSDVTGLHEASVGKIPSGVRAAKMLEALQMGDMENVSDPVDNLTVMLRDVAEFIFELVSVKQITKRALSIPGAEEKIDIMGARGFDQNTGNPGDSEIVKIDPLRVQVNMEPAMGYTAFGKRSSALELFQAGALPVEELWRYYAVSNISDVAEKMENRLNMAIRQQQGIGAPGMTPPMGDGGMGNGEPVATTPTAPSVPTAEVPNPERAVRP